jgi:predicted DNA-binding transcriptional regulator YafY
VHEFDPFTLVAYRGGLYLLGRSSRYEDLRYLAIERMKTVEAIRASDGGYEVFAYPPDYDPAKRMDGLFGIVEGKATKVALLLRSERTVELLRPRSVHPTEKYENRPDGTAILRMTVNGTAELLNWVLSHSPWVEVLEPGWLREEIAERVKETARLYA